MSAVISMKICMFEGCGKKHCGHGLCAAHLRQFQKGRPLTVLRRRRKNGTGPVIEFDEVPCRRPDLEGPCRVFRGCLSEKGYGRVRVNGKTILVHRYVFEQANGPIPVDREIDHMCRNRACCNVKHLRAVPHQVNATENVEGTAWQIHAAKTHCPRGHEYSKENTRLYRGWRHCRTCSATRGAKQQTK